MIEFYRFFTQRNGLFSHHLNSHWGRKNSREIIATVLSSLETGGKLPMLMSRINPCVPQPDAEDIHLFRSAATAIISDNLSRLPGAVGLRPFHSGGIMVGCALTVRTAGGDNLMIHRALDLVRPGDVIVVDGGGDTSRALIGEIMATLAASRGAAGMVIDGAIRDAGALAKSAFPVFGRAAIHRGPYKNGPGEINVPVTIGGMTVEPGDIVVGDEDGVVAFPQSIARELAKAVAAQEDREAEMLLSIREGRYQGAYAK